MVFQGCSSTTSDGPLGCVPIQSSAYVVDSSRVMSSLSAPSAKAMRATADSSPNLPHAYVCTMHLSGKQRISWLAAGFAASLARSIGKVWLMGMGTSMRGGSDLRLGGSTPFRTDGEGCGT
jgi:hypothetical protein